MAAGALASSAAALPQDAQPPLAVTPIPTWQKAREAGDRSRAEARPDEARAHYLQALWFRPGGKDEIALLDALVELAPAPSGERALWGLRRLEQSCDEEGRVRPVRDWADALAPLGPLAYGLPKARAEAASELERMAREARKNASRRPELWLEVRWAAETAAVVLAASPALSARAREWIERDRRPFPDLSREVTPTVQRLGEDALARGSEEDALRAGRILVGLGSQIATEGLRGPKPTGLDWLGARGAALVGAARSSLERRRGAPFTVAELEQMPLQERDALDAIYTDFGFPALAVSPHGLYTIETSCGLETLLGVARTIELHHARLVNWYGRDPFDGRPGLVRIVPEVEGLEAEGGTQWWAGGFQAGDTTVMRFAIGTIEGLGHGLTHELTHRFDGVIWPGMPGWAVEGRAVWTGSAYGGSPDTQFVENHGGGGAMHDATLRGYHDGEKLKKLVAGENERYRDNYTAGYALWLYLATWEEDGKRIYAPNLEQWMRGCAKAKKHYEWFLGCFVDGKDGRPAEWDGFVAAWRKWLDGWWWEHPAQWTARYTTATPPAPQSPLVLDRRTWPWTLGRAEPVFGEHHARGAADLLAGLGQAEEALQAFVWSFSVDQRSPDADRACAGVLDALGRKGQAWMLRARQGAARGEAPFASGLPRTRALLAKLREAAEAGAQRPVLAAALRADHDLLADRLGIPRLGPLPAAAGLDPGTPPLAEPPRGVAREAWGEAGLCDFDERRVEHLWYVDERGDLHVGRPAPRQGTGTQDRSAAVRDGFALASDWMAPGRWRLRASVHLTTTYASGAVVIGYESYSRNVRLRFGSGDYMYSIGKTEEQAPQEGLSWSLGGRFERSGALGLHAGGSHRFASSAASFEVELLVDGPLVLCLLDGEEVGRYRTPDGTPIEGRVGFATDVGAVRVSGITLQRLDRPRAAGLRGRLPPVLDLAASSLPDFRGLLGLELVGLAHRPTGVLAAWAPAPDPADGLSADELAAELAASVEHDASCAGRLLDALAAATPIVLLVPDCVAAGGEQALAERAQAEAGRPVEILTYRCPTDAGAGQDGESEFETGRPSFLFVDPSGVIRERQMPVAQPTDELRRWVSVFRLGPTPPALRQPSLDRR